MPFLHQVFARARRFSIQNAFKRFMETFALAHPDQIKDDLDYWRTRIAFSALAAGMALSLAALIPAVTMALSEDRWMLLAADLAAFALTGSLLVFRQVGIKLRATLMLLVIFTVGVFIVRDVGFLSGGPAWLFCFAVMASVLLGLKAALSATFLNALVLVGLAWLTDHDAGVSTARLVTGWANFVFLNALAAISVSVLVNGLQALNHRTRQATAALEQERAELLETKEELQREIRVRKNSEKALRASERKYRLLAENISDVIWTMDLEFRLTYVSPAGEAMQGWSPGEFLGLRLDQILTPDSVEKVMTEFSRRYDHDQKAGSFQGASTVEVEMYRKDGTTMWAEVTASFILNEDNTPIGILGVTRDITERRRAQRENEMLLERLNRSRKMEAIGTLAGGVAHDLNNVLSGIVSYPDLLLLDMPEDSPLRRPIEVMRDSGKKAAAIVQDLLTLARRGVAVSEVANLNSLIADYLDSPEFARLKSFHPDVEVDTRIDGRLLNILGSPVHLSKSIMNLVSNAAESMPEGGRITITTGNRTVERPVRGFQEVPPGDYALIQVADEGVGIAPKDLQRIFEPFYTKKKMGRSGTGLGMAVVWGTVQDHHGYIDVRSREGAGTTIDLYFPVTGQERLADTKAVTIEAIKGHGEKILIVDDVREQREIATRIIEQLGYEAAEATGGEEAIAYLKENRADLVLLDMIMDGGIDGLETYEGIVAINPRQKAIITSGFAETERVQRAQDLGAGCYVRKPYTIGALGQAIKAELG